MAEVKNSFIKSKMNKDLDARLLPNGEYREGINIQVSKSEGADVGALENVLGNQQLVDFRALSGCSCDLQTIGTFTDGVSDNIYVFLTNYTDAGFETAITYNKDAYNYIYVYNILNQESHILVSGSFLNFSTTNPILNVNFLEGLLFFTDNRNQPRRINVDRAITGATAQVSNGYYYNEDQISVATYNPYEPIELYFKQWGSVVTKNQTTASATISVNKDTLIGLPTFGATVSGTGVVGSPTISAYNSSTGILTLSSTQTIDAGVKLSFYVASNFNATDATQFSSMFDATSRYAPDGSTLNPTFQTGDGITTNYPGDPDFLEDKFVRFSYRFKFDGGENSIFAPFTQPAFIPKQDGYFLNDDSSLSGNTKDENDTYRTTIVGFMENQVNNILLQIPLPCAAKDLYAQFKVIEIDILYKESDGLAVQVVDTIQTENLTESDQVLVYNYQSTKPYKTLPESDLIRVYDKVPVKAHGQELISNRVVYSNFQTQHTPPESLNYNVGITQKEDFDVSNSNSNLHYTSSVEYPMHTVKQNRNYQVGVILSDKYGRSSTTLLSSAVVQAVQDSITYGGSTVYFPYHSDPGTGNNNINSWKGDSIKVLFNQAIGTNGVYAGDPDLITGWPGLHNGDATSSDYNPLGWYSYKIVVKQQEQEYYNVYLPGIVNGYPGDVAGAPDPANTTAFITLINDNINKVPRDLTEVGPQQVQFGSSVNLFGRVTPEQTAIGTQPTYNNQYYPTIEPNVVNTIGPENTLLDSSTTFSEVYQTATNPLVGRVSQTVQTLSTGIGTGAIGSGPVTSGSAYNIVLGVYETTPVESRLEIFWETTSTGLISELNEAIEVDSPGLKGLTSDGISTKWTYSQSEANPSGTIISDFIPYKKPNPLLGITEATDTTLINYWVTDGLGNTRATKQQQDNANDGDFIVETGSAGRYNLKTNNTFYYGNNASVLESYTFTFEIYDNTTDLTSTVSGTGSLINAVPVFTNCVATVDPVQGSTTLYTYLANNGSADTTNNTLDLTYSLISQTPTTPVVTIDADTGVLSEITGSLNGPLQVTVQVKDASGATGALSALCTTDFNGSQGIATIPTNPDFYSGTAQIARGPESVGFYWSTDKTNEVSSTPLPGGSIGFRAPVNNTPMPSDTIGATGMSTAQVSATGSCGQTGPNGTGGWVWTNTNKNALSLSSSNVDPIGLTAGTAYLLVRFIFTTPNGIAQNDQPSCIWPAYLQYRNPSGSGYPNNWTNAVDVEGQTVSFGGTQINNYQITPNGTGDAAKSRRRRGVINQATTSEALTDGQYQKNDAFEVQIDGKQNSTDYTLGSIGSRIVVFGKDQGYGTTADYYGDYRLVIRYPYGDNIPNFLSSDKIIPVLTPQGCPGDISTSSPYAYYNSANQNQTIQINYGDFYSPNLTDPVTGALTNSTTVPSYYEYKISVNGSATKENAKSFSPSTVVYAREWSFRYITQLYSNPELTETYTATTSNYYYSYTASSNDSINARNGSENSNTTNTPNSQGDNVPATNATDENRRWVAQFNASGKKIAGTAEPITYNEGSGSLPSPPTGAVQLNSNNDIVYPSVQNSGSSVIITWTNGSGQTTRATLFVTAVTNGLGGENPAPFVGSFLKWYSPDSNTGYELVNTTTLNMNSTTSQVSYSYQNTSGHSVVTIENAQLVSGNLSATGNWYYDIN